MISTDFKPFYQRKKIDGYRGMMPTLGNRYVVVPEKYRPQVLRELHSGHPGSVRMKGIVKAHEWWPGVNSDIEATVQTGVACQSDRHPPPLVVLHLWPWPTRSWKRIHIDYVEPFLGTMFLIVVDAYSKRLEVIPMQAQLKRP